MKSTPTTPRTASSKGKSSAGSQSGDDGKTSIAPPKNVGAGRTADRDRNTLAKRRTRPLVAKASAPEAWGVVAATVPVVLVAVDTIGYASHEVQNNTAVTDPSDVEAIQTSEYAAGQDHLTTPVTCAESGRAADRQFGADRLMPKTFRLARQNRASPLKCLAAGVDAPGFP